MRGVKLIALIACVALLGCLPRRVERSVGGRVTIDVWHVWGGTQAEAIAKIVAEFERTHPNIHVNAVFTRNDLSTSQKFFTAVAAQTPPEVIFVDGPQVAPWAEWGALEPLDARIEKAGIRQDDYFPPCWQQNSYRGHVWALTYCADPNFGFVWNKDAFRRAGLDPERPPRTVEELDEYARRLTTTDSNGQLSSIGFIPWAQYGPANSMFTWGWAFGGEFYDYGKSQITCDNERVIAALDWMAGYAREYDVRRIGALEAGFGTQEQDPFYTGKMAMRCLHIGGIADIERYAPDLEYGVTFIPFPEGGEERSSWVGGWCIGIPRGAQHQEEAFEFLRWVCHDPAGTELVGEASGLFPAVRNSPYFDKVRGKPYYSAFLEIINACKHQRPVTPVQAFYMRELQRAVDEARFGKLTPREALRNARVNTQRELDLIKAGWRETATSPPSPLRRGEGR